MNFAKEFLYKNIPWYKNSGALLPLTLPHQPIDLSEPEARQLLKQTQSYLIRWHEGFDTGTTTNWWFIIKDKPMEFSEYRKNDRYKIIRGMKRFESRILYKNEITVENLYPVYMGAFSRYKTFEKILDRKNFEEKIFQMISSHEIYGVFYQRKLAGFSINLCNENSCFFRYIYFDPPFLSGYSSYVFFYGICNHYLNDRKFKYVTDGARSVSHQTKVHDFLETKFGFRKAYCELKIKYRWDVNLGVKLLFPFRKILYGMDGSLIKKINVAMFQEEINREGRK